MDSRRFDAMQPDGGSQVSRQATNGTGFHLRQPNTTDGVARDPTNGMRSVFIEYIVRPTQSVRNRSWGHLHRIRLGWAFVLDLVDLCSGVT